MGYQKKMRPKQSLEEKRVKIIQASVSSLLLPVSLLHSRAGVFLQNDGKEQLILSMQFNSKLL